MTPRAHRRALVLAVACLLPACGARQEVCASWSPLAQSACPLAENAIAQLEELLDSRLAGQTLAALAVRKALAQSVERYAKARIRKRDMLASYVLGFPHSILNEQEKRSTTRRETLFLHFSGPTGVGKSLTANLMARALFTSPGAQCGVMNVNLNEHRSNSQKKWAMRRLLADTLQTFRDQLALCPRSVFVLDEIQSVHRDLVDELLAFFLPQGLKAHGLSVVYPVVVLISDLGSEKLQPNMARADAVAAISAAAQSRFGSGAGAAATERVLMRNLVPFLPLSEEELAQVVTLQLGGLLTQLRTEFGASWRGKLTWQPQVAQAMAHSCFHEPTCNAEGGRGIESKVQHDLQGDVEALIAECLDMAESEAARGQGEGEGERAGGGGSVCFDNVDVRVARGGRGRGEGGDGDGRERGELEIVLDAVYGKDEFEGYHEGLFDSGTAEHAAGRKGGGRSAAEKARKAEAAKEAEEAAKKAAEMKRKADQKRKEEEEKRKADQKRKEEEERRKAEQKRAEEEEKAQLKAQPCTNADGEGFDVYQCDMDHPNLFSECREKQAECANLNKEL